jgi:hypothetical protein
MVYPPPTRSRLFELPIPARPALRSRGCARRHDSAVTRLIAAGTATIAMVVQRPLAAMACPYCYASSGTHLLHTYYLSTVLLTLLPFAIIGSIFVIARRVGRRTREQYRRGSAVADAFDS